jgi:hypothetical protein
MANFPPFATHDSHVRCFGNPQRVTHQGIWYQRLFKADAA